jgi:predicted phage replisome organizer/uncharacterized phage protein (TIGR02220 family)
LADVKWIKIVTDIFDDEKILLIESMPEADAVIVIWFKLLTLAGKINNGGVLMFNDKLPYTDEMLATIFRRPINTVRLAIKTFENFGMVEVINNTITIPNWSKHQTLDQLEERKEYMKNYMREYRDKQKLLAEGKVNSKANSKANVNSLEEDIEEEVDIDNKIYSPVIEYLNSVCKTNYKTSSKKTKSLIDARVNEGFTLEDFKKVIDIKSAEWLNTDMAKYLRPETLFGTKFEGYLNQSGPVKPKPTNKFHNFIQSDMDGEDLEAMARKRFEKLIQDKQ